MFRWLVLSCLLLGCQRNPEVPTLDRMVVSMTEQAWKDQGLPDPEDCLEDVGIQVLHGSNFMQLCGVPAAFSVGCAADRNFGNFGGRKLIYVSPSVNPKLRDKALAHLTLHALCSCTTEAVKDKTDEAHFRKGVWVDSSGENSVEAAVYSKLDNRLK